MEINKLIWNPGDKEIEWDGKNFAVNQGVLHISILPHERICVITCFNENETYPQSNVIIYNAEGNQVRTINITEYGRSILFNKSVVRGSYLFLYSTSQFMYAIETKTWQLFSKQYMIPSAQGYTPSRF